MSFIIILFPFFKALFYFLLINLGLFFKVLFCVILFFTQRYLKTIVDSPRDVSLFAYKIEDFTRPMLYIFGYIIFFLIFLTTYRFIYIDRIIDIKKNANNLYKYLMTTHLLTISINIITLIFTIIILISLYKILKKDFVKEFTKLHLYFTHDIAISRASSIILRALERPAYLLDTFLTRIFFKNSSKKTLRRLTIFCENFIDNLGLWFLLFFFFFDFIFNNMIITKVFYILPFAYIYMQVYLYKKFFYMRAVFDDLSLKEFYYNEILYINEDGVGYTNGNFIDKEFMDYLQQHIRRNFTVTGDLDDMPMVTIEYKSK